MEQQTAPVCEPEALARVPHGKRLLTLALVFLKIGCFTFGGGWSIIAQIEKEFIEKRGWSTETDILDFTSVGRSLPGMMIGNIAIMFGYRIAGIAGAFVTAGSMLAAPFGVMVVVVKLYDLIRANLYVAATMRGVRAAVVPMILCALIKLFKPAMQDNPCYIIGAAALLLSLFGGVSYIAIVVAGVTVGVILTEVRARRDLH
ncbi:MAG: chromate transporter [Clostridia bacterium]|nr:chromate transporter [Clostridia bacterium]